MAVIHHVPGRLRIRLSEVKGNPAKAHSIERALGAFPGVNDVASNIRTGSVLVHYDPKTADVSSVLSMLYVDCGITARYPLPERERDIVREKIAQKVASVVVGILIEKAIERSVPMLLAALL
jgi:copper chaperone CopZ